MSRPLIIFESISIKPDTISKFYDIFKLFESQGQRWSRPFYGSDKVEKASNVQNNIYLPLQVMD